jgi:hypothetical protein
MTLTMVLGGLGAGKTLFSTILACHSPRPVHSNFTIRCDQYVPFDLNAFLDGRIEDAMVLLDEAYVYLESRVSSRLLNRVLSYVLFQSRKMGMNIVVTTQLSSSLDVRFRDLADYVVRARHTGAGFSYRIMSTETKVVKEFFLPITKASAYFPRFDTLERVEPVEALSEVKRVTLPAEEKLAEAMRHARAIVHAIKREFGPDQKPTRDLVAFFVEAMQVERYLHDLVYVCARKEFKAQQSRATSRVLPHESFPTFARENLVEQFAFREQDATIVSNWLSGLSYRDIESFLDVSRGQVRRAITKAREEAIGLLFEQFIALQKGVPVDAVQHHVAANEDAPDLVWEGTIYTIKWRYDPSKTLTFYQSQDFRPEYTKAKEEGAHYVLVFSNRAWGPAIHEREIDPAGDEKVIVRKDDLEI